MVSQLAVTNESLQKIADDVARSLSHATVEGRSAFVSTTVTYANGTHVVIRLDQDGDNFFVSDDGYASLNADMFGGAFQFQRIAADVAKRFGISYDQRSFFILKATKNQLPAAVTLIANASAASIERALYALDRIKIKKTKDLFVERISKAFGDKASFNVDFRGSTKAWEVDAAIIDQSNVVAIFEFVSPAATSVAVAYMKVGDISAMIERPRTAIVLSDYDKTDPPLRQILSSSADVVIAADSDLEAYRRVA
jgi:hypothetical protein